jgi:hypothetical protein
MVILKIKDGDRMGLHIKPEAEDVDICQAWSAPSSTS